MSGVSIIEHLTGPLGDAYKALAKKWSPEVVEQGTKVGGVFSDLAAKDPVYFATSKELPAANATTQQKANFLMLKHGIPSPLVDDGMGGISHSGTYGGSGASVSYGGSTPNELAKKIADPNLEDWQKVYFRDHLDFARRAGMGLNSQPLSVDMMNADAGTGLAKKLYPAFYEYMLAHPGTGMATESLTEANLQKRLMHQAGLLEKYPWAHNRVETIPEQLDAIHGNARNNVAFNKMDPTGQIGMMNLITANNTQAKLQSLIDHAHANVWELGSSEVPKDQAKRGILLEAIGNLEKLGLGKDGLVSPSMNFDAVSKAVRDLATKMGIAQPVGKDSLRRAAITNEVLGNTGMRAEDLVGSELTKGLAKAKGGRVVARSTPCGPLTQCCGGAK